MALRLQSAFCSLPRVLSWRGRNLQFSSLCKTSFSYSSSCAVTFAFRSSPRTSYLAVSTHIKIKNPLQEGYCYTAATMSVRDDISLNEKEKKIFDKLKQVLSHFNLQTQLRVAGGWVRDKLMGKESSDIDIALDNMLGREFCEKVNEYLAMFGEEARAVGIIQSNPDQSKHLETATMRIYGIQIDFVNLRSEKYAEDSRIPSMEFGTPEQDAYRRDLTINSLFYNINTDSVEDWTGRGISDLKAGIIATPLQAKTTFLDDPLRVLRAIRFGARFKFMLDDELQKAAATDEVIDALKSKISRERIGHEVDLMISGNQPDLAVSQLKELRLFSSVFLIPENLTDALPCNVESLCVRNLEELLKVFNTVESTNFDTEQRRLCLYGALLLPYKASRYLGPKGKLSRVTNYIVKESLKLRTKDAEKIIELHEVAEEFNLIDLQSQEEAVESEIDGHETWLIASRKRIQTGLILRKIKELWRAALMLSTLLRYPSSANSENESLEQLTEKRATLYKSAETSVLNLDLENIWDLKPLLNGKEVIECLRLRTGGPEVKELLEELIKWQLAHPNGTKEEGISWLEGFNSKRQKIH